MMCSSHGPSPGPGPDVAVGGQQVRGHREQDHQDDADHEGRAASRRAEHDHVTPRSNQPPRRMAATVPRRPADDDRQDDGE